MGIYLAVWYAEAAPTLQEALGYYRTLAEARVITKWNPNVEAFYGDLCLRYPEIDSLEEDALDRCPW